MIESSAIFKLGLTSVILLIFNTYYLINISFQLSFIIVFGLYYFSFLLKKSGYFKKILYFGLISFLFSFPVLLFYFQKSSLVSIIVTPLIMPVIEIIIIIGSLFLYFPFLKSLLFPFGYCLKLIIGFLKGLTETLNQNFPSLLIKGPQPELFFIFIFYGLLILLGLFLRGKKRGLVVLCSISLSLLSLFLLLPKNHKGLAVHFINVGQGDSILITTPVSHKRILLDGGRKSMYVDMGKKEVIPYLERQGYFSLDLIISSHGDEDHRGGLETVLDKMPVALVLLPPLHYDDKGDY